MKRAALVVALLAITLSSCSRSPEGLSLDEAAADNDDSGNDVEDSGSWFIKFCRGRALGDDVTLC